MTLTEWYDSIDKDAILHFVADRRQEDVSLDFKRVTEDSIKRSLAKAVSGFANAVGGLVVWGVDARKNGDGVDCVTGLVEVSPLAALVTRLNELTYGAASPAPDVVRHRGIEVSGPDCGVALTIVPQTDSGPHMAGFGDHRYYRRTTTGFPPMEHYEVADLFGRRRRPVLTVLAEVVDQDNVLVSIANEGRGAARAPYLALQPQSPYGVSAFGADGNGGTGLRRLVVGNAASGEARFGGDGNVVIHPGQRLDVTRLWLGLHRPSGFIPPPMTVVRYRVGAEDSALIEGAIEVRLRE
jgi:hypothetical protein